MLVATAMAYTCYRIKLGSIWPLGWLDLGVLFLEVVFLATSRDTLQKYYRRSEQLLSPGHSQPSEK